MDLHPGESSDAYDQAYNDNHEGKLSHEILAGGASFAAMHAFEERQRKEGKPVNHEFAKELIASFAGAEVDKLVETKGLDYVDKEKAKHQAKQNAERLYDEQYGQYDQYDPQQQGPPEHLQRQFGGYDNY
ncbi:hypothetical protein D6D19_08426 [Aureobasidium pullulans]|uniref:CipC-like antibiotic response protein n=2 Tax=Aureobasidium pullulans TaxID=5580 RepID=A0A4S8U1H9_AURPU|nr:hypothetical protein D6D28_08848 [Aureobasidium pullulans]THV91307.1 hypothetical protein D6D26_09111 [Aureobasidium pullulans]THW69365.1 hypothetical protein D6D19_08426 [Aureobasidium pullulans]THX98973.1 hypothetical protein D6D02_09271 [Aureobasidium pullulans]THZ91972.1 hypothetical protein D6C82_09662 [Aureobasidium pullulans]